jgi:peptidoglycan-associated lipoprotein
MMNAKVLLTFAALGLAMAGCSSSGTAPSGSAGPVDDGFTPFDGGDGDSTASTAGIGSRGGGEFIGFDGEQPGDAELILNNLVLYFEFDSSEIRSEFNEMLAAHGRYLASDSGLTVRLEGHADERGSREYNIGLGERRAQAVRQILLLQGVSAAQLSTVSFGEERPAVIGSDEEAYSLNRRVELVYR